MVTFEQFANRTPADSARLILLDHFKETGSIKETAQEFRVDVGMVYKVVRDSTYVLPALPVRYILSHYITMLNKRKAPTI